jgi:hypothetical protein
MDGHQGPQGLNRIPPIGRLTVTTPLTRGFIPTPTAISAKRPRRLMSRNENHREGLAAICGSGVVMSNRGLMHAGVDWLHGLLVRHRPYLQPWLTIRTDHRDHPTVLSDDKASVELKATAVSAICPRLAVRIVVRGKDEKATVASRMASWTISAPVGNGGGSRPPR